MTEYVDWQQRVVNEWDELAEKVKKLEAIMDTALFASLDANERFRMRQQRLHMLGYLGTLKERIVNFVKKETTA